MIVRSQRSPETSSHMNESSSPLNQLLIGIAGLLFCISSMLHGGPVRAAQEVEILVDSDYKPYSYEVDGQAEGVYPEILRAVTGKMEGYKVTLVPVPWPRGKKMMADGTAYALAPPYYHGHDWPYLYPYSLAMYSEVVRVVCTKEVLATPRPRWPEDYTGLYINNMAGFDGWGGAQFHELVKAGKIHYQEVKGIEKNITMLMLRRADCILIEDHSFDAIYPQIKTNQRIDKGVNYAELEKGPITGEDSVYLGYSAVALEKNKYPFHKDFRRKFDNSLYQIIKSGELRKIAEKAFLKANSRAQRP